ncbi:hypothetical protein ACWJOD_23095, partial [Escherichia coli]
SGAGRTSDGNGSHASTLKSPSYTKSVSWQHYPFSDGFTNSELYDIEPEERQRIVNGAYDVLCTTCKGSGKVKVPNIREMSFGEKRALVERRREQRELDELSQMEKMERMMGC